MSVRPNPDARITLIAGTWLPMRCGIAPYSRRLAQMLSGRGWRVTVVVDDRADPETGFPTLRIHRWSLREVAALVRRLRRPGPQIVHLQHPTRATRLKPAVYLLPLLARIVLPKRPVVTTFHYLRPVDLRTALLRMFFLFPAACSQAVVVTTEREATYLRTFFPRKQIMVSPAGLTFEMVKPSDAERRSVRAELGFGEQDFVVVFFGYLLPGKGIETLIHAMARLDEDIKLLIVGATYQDGDRYRHRLNDIAARSGVGDRSVWTGMVSEAEAEKFLGTADCAALPFDEGVSLKRSTLFAALQVGLPVVTTTGPEVDPAMRDGRNLLLVPPRDPVALAAAIARLRDDPPLAATLKENGGELLQLVSWERIASVHDALYSRLLGDR